MRHASSRRPPLRARAHEGRLTVARRFALTFAAAVVGCSPAISSAPASSSPAAGRAPAPPAGVALDAHRLEALLHAFAADSMLGREAGTEGHEKAARFLAEHARAYGLLPAGADGTYFQEVPLLAEERYSTLRLPTGPVEVGPDFAPLVFEDLNTPASMTFDGIEVVYGGDMASRNEISGIDAVGKIVVLGAIRTREGRVFGLVGETLEALAGARAILMASLDYADPELRAYLLDPQTVLDEPGAEIQDDGEGPFLAFVSEALVERIFGAPVGAVRTGTVGAPLLGEVGTRTRPLSAPSRNVIARIEGSDPQLRDEYVVISAHSDHTGIQGPAVDHDSLRAYLEVVRPNGAETPERTPTPLEAERIRSILAAAAGPSKLDSINNGADDDASGSVALLEIGRTLAASPRKPRRSVLLVWHTAEEAGLLGSSYFTDHPTVPIGDIVATVNVDMIGRGGEDDLPDGGPRYLQLIGSRRLSTELGTLVEAVNREEGFDFAFDYQFDADGHPANFYCRSDHYMYARFGIPIVFMSTGGHRDYHMRTDEAQYIDYEKLSRVGGFVLRVASRIADLERRLQVDGRIPDPEEPCRQ